MRKQVDYRAALVLAAGLAGASMLSGYVVRPYDGEHSEPQGDAREDVAYRHYLVDQELEYRDYNDLTPVQQRDYWDWRNRYAG